MDLCWHGCNVRLLTEVQSSSGELHETAAMTLPHAKAAAARPLRHEHDIHLESGRLLLSLIVAILAGRDAQRRFFAVDSSLASLGRWDDEQSVMQERSPRLGLCRSSYLHPSTHCYDALVLLNFQPSAQPAREVSVRELERQVPARLAKEELSKRKVSAQQARQSQKSCLLTMKACEDARLLGALVHSRIAAAITATTHRTMPTLVK